MRKTFTLSEAQTLLPVLQSLMTRAREAGIRAGEAGAELDELRQRIFLAGGMQVDVAEVARRRSEQGVALEQAKTTVAEIEEIGARVHDLAEGLLDLPFRDDAGEIMLCWQMDEGAVTHWHADEEEPAERLPLESRIGRGDRERLN